MYPLPPKKAVVTSISQDRRIFVHFFSLDRALIFVWPQTWLQSGLVLPLIYHSCSDLDWCWCSERLCSIIENYGQAVTAWSAPNNTKAQLTVPGHVLGIQLLDQENTFTKIVHSTWDEICDPSSIPFQTWRRDDPICLGSCQKAAPNCSSPSGIASAKESGPSRSCLLPGEAIILLGMVGIHRSCILAPAWNSCEGSFHHQIMPFAHLRFPVQSWSQIDFSLCPFLLPSLLSIGVDPKIPL